MIGPGLCRRRIVVGEGGESFGGFGLRVIGFGIWLLVARWVFCWGAELPLLQNPKSQVAAPFAAPNRVAGPRILRSAHMKS